jgi:hypothetical protein
MRAQRTDTNLQELVLGACVGVSVIADALVREGLIERVRWTPIVRQPEPSSKV